MTNSKKHYLIQLAHILPKIQRRMPSGIQRSRLWERLEDSLYSRGLLSGKNGREIWDSFHRSVSPQDWFAFAGKTFPAHQQRDEILGFLSMAILQSPRVVMEIGTAQSGTNFLLGQIMDSVEILIAMDLRVRNMRLLSHFSRTGLNRVFLEGSSYTPSSYERVKNVLSGRPLDVLFIDGDHTYDGVKADYQMYRSLVRKGGLIAFHDIVDDHQTKYGRPGIGWAGGVPQFWRELKLQNEFSSCNEFIADPDQDGMGIGVLQT
jgi:cephalosporin hydroxylase